jgi:hypothetical protein
MTEGPEPCPPEKGLLPCEIWIDREGDWYHRGARMERADIVAHLCQHLARDESRDCYVIRTGKEDCYLEVEDTPLVITRVISEGGEEGGEAKGFLLGIKYLDQTEPLDPTSLRVGRDNVLYCTVRPERLPARFLRPAYYQLAEFVCEDHERGGFYLPVAGRRYPIGSSVTA